MIDPKLAALNKKRREAGYHKMTDFRIDFASNVDRPAQEPAVGMFMKRADGTAPGAKSWKPIDRLGFVKQFMADTDGEGASRGAQVVNALGAHDHFLFDAVSKGCDRAPIMLEAEDGHTHLIWLDDGRGGTTSWGQAEGSEYGHEHAWVIGEDGTLKIGENHGHTHGVGAASVMAAMRDILTGHQVPEVAVDVIFSDMDGKAVDVEKAELQQLIDAIDCGAIVVKNLAGQRILNAAHLPDGSFPIRTEDDLLTAIRAVDADSDQHRAARLHVVKRARALGLADWLPDELVRIAEKAARPGGSASPDSTKEPEVDPKVPNIADLLKRLEKNEADTNRLRSIVALSAAHREHYEGLDDVDKAAFLAKSAEEQAKEVAETGDPEPNTPAPADPVDKSADPVVYTAKDGTQVRKSDGALVLRMAKQLDQQAQELLGMRVEKADNTFAKQADEVVPLLKGEAPTRTALMKAVGSIADEVQRQKVLETLKAANEAMALTAKNRGTSAGSHGADGNGERAADQLDALTKSYMQDKGESDYYKAYGIVSDANPELATRAVKEG